MRPILKGNLNFGLWSVSVAFVDCLYELQADVIG
jgi:hypothetical protein